MILLCHRSRRPDKFETFGGATITKWLNMDRRTRTELWPLPPPESYAVRSPATPSAACAAASRATGTRYGLHET